MLSSRELLDRYIELVDIQTERARYSREELRKFLTFVNSGGAVSVIGFIGATQSLGGRPWATVLALSMFSVGILLVGLGLYRYALEERVELRRRHEILQRVRVNLKDGRAPQTELRKEVEKNIGAYRVGRKFWPPFTAFVLGLMLAVIAIFPSL